MDDITKEDIEVLLEAMEAWEGRRLSGEILLGLAETFSLKITEDDPFKKEEMMRKQQEKMTARAEENKRLSAKDKERSVVIRAKLLHWKDKMSVESLTKG